jgi:hypothetical protein
LGDQNNNLIIISKLFTNISFYFGYARFALDRTAPFELALALFLLDHLFDGKSTTTTHDSATIVTRRGLVALAAPSAQYVHFGVLKAVVGAFVQIDEVFIRWLAEAAVSYTQLICFGLHAYFHCIVVLFFEHVAYLVKRCHFKPTGLHATRTRHAVTFAFDLDVLIYGLQKRI